MSKFVINAKFDQQSLGDADALENIEVEPKLTAEDSGEPAKLCIQIGAEKKLIGNKEAKALARYLNSWAGLQEASNAFDGTDYVWPALEGRQVTPEIHITGGTGLDKAEISRIITKALKKVDFDVEK